MADEIQQSDHDEILEALVSFNDPGIIVSLFRQLGWSYTLEIQETIKLAKQNANLSIKFKAIKHLRELLKDAAETSGYIADVSTTSPNPQGGQTTFHARRMAGFLNPTKHIESKEIKESQDDREPKIEYRECDRQESFGGTDTNSVFPSDADRSGETANSQTSGSECTESSDGLGGTSATDRGTSLECGQSRGSTGGIQQPTTPIDSKGTPDGKNAGIDSGGSSDDSAEDDNPCVKIRPPTCNRRLYPGISQSEDKKTI